MTTHSRWVCTACGAFTIPHSGSYGSPRPCACYRCCDQTEAVLVEFVRRLKPHQLSLPGIRGRRRPAPYREVQP